MQIPMRVEWTEPDEPKRKAACEQIEQDAADYHRGSRANTRYPYRALVACRSPDERSDVLARHYPDLHAVVTYFGTLLAVHYTPEQWGVKMYQRGGVDLGSTGAQPVKLCDSKWVALVATEHGTREMDPAKLRVMWTMSAGDPIGGVVLQDDLERRKGEAPGHIRTVAEQRDTVIFPGYPRSDGPTASSTDRDKVHIAPIPVAPGGR